MANKGITGVILAGGRSSRMGEDKALVKVNGKPLFAYIAERLMAITDEVIINSNSDSDEYSRSFQVVADADKAFSGPLAGMLAGLQASRTAWVLFIPCDVPSYPDDLLSRFWQQKSTYQAVYARDSQREHPTLCLLNKSIIPFLVDYLASGERKVMTFFRQIKALPVVFNHPDAFSNLNTPQDLARWQAAQRDTL